MNYIPLLCFHFISIVLCFFGVDQFLTILFNLLAHFASTLLLPTSFVTVAVIHRFSIFIAPHCHVCQR